MYHLETTAQKSNTVRRRSTARLTQSLTISSPLQITAPLETTPRTRSSISPPDPIHRESRRQHLIGPAKWRRLPLQPDDEGRAGLESDWLSAALSFGVTRLAPCALRVGLRTMTMVIREVRIDGLCVSIVVSRASR